MMLHQNYESGAVGMAEIQIVFSVSRVLADGDGFQMVHPVPGTTVLEASEDILAAITEAMSVKGVVTTQRVAKGCVWSAPNDRGQRAFEQFWVQLDGVPAPQQAEIISREMGEVASRLDFMIAPARAA